MHQQTTCHRAVVDTRCYRALETRQFGCYPGVATERSENGGWLPYAKEYAAGPSGEVTGFRMPNGELASAEQIKEDCEAWKTSFARNQRASFIQNHDHDCTGTCVKYLQKKNATELPQRTGQKIAGPGVPKCRFRNGSLERRVQEVTGANNAPRLRRSSVVQSSSSSK